MTDQPTPLHRKRRRWRVIVIVSSIMLALFLVYAVVSRIGYNVVVTPNNHWEPLVPEGAYEEVSFPSRGRDYPVYAFLQQGDSDGNGNALINVHGRFSSRHSPYQLERAAMLHALGYTVLTIDLSDNGGDTIEDGRSSLGFDEQWDVLGAYDYLLSLGYAPDHIGLVGESMGGATVLSAASHEPRIRAIWADSPYNRADTVLAEQALNADFSPIFIPGGMIWGLLTAGDRIWEVAPINAGETFAANDQAVYLLHCEGDGLVYYHHSVDLDAAYRAAGVDVAFWSVPCQEHTTAMREYTDEYRERLDGFFAEHLAGA
jgi:dipeptidyl aminopeptidase/acylaminoacyl peptidase